MKTVEWLRKEYTQFFMERTHKLYPSASLVPAEDPSLMFTTAGMVQFKDNYVTNDGLPDLAVTTIQKCLRTTDLDIVGTTDRHCTFFEMLGNFSFGDYFKRKAIEMAWEFTITKLEFPEEKVWITVYEEDDEAYDIWHKEIGIPAERIVRLGKKDNYWGPAGDSGPCGPCSELYLDRGVEKGGPDDLPGDDTDRFIEFWNLVFVGYFSDKSGNKTPLENPGIDTGAGLERIVCLLQEVDSVYDTDEFKQLIEKIEKTIDHTYTPDTKTNFRVMADHIRSITFSMTDGALPSNEGRGYVIRRLIRRASLYAQKLGVKDAFLHKLVATIVEIYGANYPALKDKEKFVTELLKSEEERFLKTVSSGLVRLNELVALVKKKGDKQLPGKDIFTLYDTYGFPVELTRELALEQELSLDESGFQQEMDLQKQRAQADWKAKQDTLFKIVDDNALRDRVAGATDFAGYESVSGDSKLLYYAVDKDSNQAILVFDQTPFYAEGGGQTGDTGFARSDAAVLQIKDTQKKNDVFFHVGEIVNGELNNNAYESNWTLEVDSIRRSSVSKNHSATHLLHASLRKHLGDNLTQTGSFVGNEYLRFDFNYNRGLKSDEISAIEKWVNECISQGESVNTKEMKLDAARQAGAVANFGEKYGHEVRVVGMGIVPGEKNPEALMSMELCGGIHVDDTKDIGSFFITKEFSPGAGNRRIEAITGSNVAVYLEQKAQEAETVAERTNHRLEAVLAEMNVSFSKTSGALTVDGPLQADVDKVYISSDELGGMVETLTEAKLNANSYDELRERQSKVATRLSDAQSGLHKLGKKLQKIKADELAGAIQSKLEGKESEPFLLLERFNDQDMKSLKEMGDELRRNRPKLLLAFVNERADKTELIVQAGGDLVSSGLHSGNILKELLTAIGGRGGGKPDSAQGGAPNPDDIEAYIQQVSETLTSNLKATAG